MKNQFIKISLFLFIFSMIAEEIDAQQRRTTPRRATTRRTAAVATNTTPAIVVDTPVVAVSDTLPIRQVKKSLRPDNAVETEPLKEMIPLPYENLREADAVYRQKIWRDLDTREKINLPFRNAADEDNGNQRFISVLLKAIQDSSVTAFSSVDDRFTTPLTMAEVGRALSGDMVDVPQYDEQGNLTGTIKMANEINLDSITKFRIKEEVIFDKESSRLFWRILGIAPVKKVITSMGMDLGETEIFWLYYPDLRPTFAKYQVYNGKNYGARMSWEELFETRMFGSRIVKSTIDNPYDLYIKNYRGISDNKMLQLYESENIYDEIFNYEQDLWSY